MLCFFYIIKYLLKPGYPQPKDVVLSPISATGINIHVHQNDVKKWQVNRNRLNMKGKNYIKQHSTGSEHQFW
jgi:hypothetical protein